MWRSYCAQHLWSLVPGEIRIPINSIYFQKETKDLVMLRFSRRLYNTYILNGGFM